MATSKVPLVPGTKTLARGSVVIGNASGEPSALAIGSNTYVLKSDGTDISWGADAAGTITAFTNGVDNRVVTATSATALNGEAKLTFDGAQLSNTAETAGGYNTVLHNDNGTAKGTQIKIKANDAGQENNEAFDVTTWDTGSTYTSKLRVNRNGNAIIKNNGSGATTETLVLTNGTSANPSYSNLVFKSGGNTSGAWIKGVQASGGNDGRLEFHTNNAGTVTEAMRIMYNSTVGISNNNSFATSYLLDVNGTGTISRMNRSDDGAMLLFQSAGATEGYVAISGSTCTYYSFTGGHWGQLSDLSNPTVLKGTVIETIDEMCEWYVVEITRKKGDTEEDEIIKVPHILQVGQSVGDTITVTYEGTEYSGDIVKETNNNLAKVKISDSEDSKAVYGVFQNWDEDNDMSVVALGTFVVRINSGETVAIGDLLSSKGDGTAKVQADDIMRSRTIAKVTSTIKQTTYDDGSYTVPCTLHGGQENA